VRWGIFGQRCCGVPDGRRKSLSCAILSTNPGRQCADLSCIALLIDRFSRQALTLAARWRVRRIMITEPQAPSDRAERTGPRTHETVRG
jgi:hypothetical protein